MTKSERTLSENPENVIIRAPTESIDQLIENVRLSVFSGVVATTLIK